MSGRVLVTGGAGFIGAHLCRRLVADGYDVHATSRSARTDAEGVRWLQADLGTIEETQRTFAAVKPDVVYHLAGTVGAGPAAELVLPTYHSLLTSTVNVLVAGLERGCRRIVLSGSFTEPRGDGDWPVLTSPYAAAKWAGSAYGRMFHALYKAPVAVLRPFMAYGPGQAPGKLIPAVAAALLRGEAPKVSSGKVKADWVYIDDVVGAFAAAAERPVDGATIDLGAGELVPIRAVVERVHAITGAAVAPLFGALPDRPAELEVAADTGPALALLGWRAQTSLDEGLRRTVEARRKELSLA